MNIQILDSNSLLVEGVFNTQKDKDTPDGKVIKVYDDRKEISIGSVIPIKLGNYDTEYHINYITKKGNFYRFSEFEVTHNKYFLLPTLNSSFIANSNFIIDCFVPTKFNNTFQVVTRFVTDKSYIEFDTLLKENTDFLSKESKGRFDIFTFNIPSFIGDIVNYVDNRHDLISSELPKRIFKLFDRVPEDIVLYYTDREKLKQNKEELFGISIPDDWNLLLKPNTNLPFTI